MNQQSQKNQQQQNQTQNDDHPHLIYVNIVIKLQKSNLNMQVQIDPEIPFTIFIRGLKEQMFSNKTQSDYEDKIKCQLGNGCKINQFDEKSLRQLGFYTTCTLFIKLKLKEIGNSDSHLNQGNELYSQKPYAEAIKCFDAAIKLNQNNPEYYYGKGRTLLALNKKDEAIKQFQQAFAKQKECFQQIKSTANMLGS